MTSYTIPPATSGIAWHSYSHTKVLHTRDFQGVTCNTSKIKGHAVFSRLFPINILVLYYVNYKEGRVQNSAKGVNAPLCPPPPQSMRAVPQTLSLLSTNRTLDPFFTPQMYICNIEPVQEHCNQMSGSKIILRMH